MGVAPEQKLIIKHGFLEYVCEEVPLDSKPLRQRSQTEPIIDLNFTCGEISKSKPKVTFGEVTEVTYEVDSYYSGSDDECHMEPACNDDDDDEPNMVLSTPESSPLRCPSYNLALPHNEHFEQCLPAPALCAEHITLWQYTNGYHWAPIPYGVSMGMPIAYCNGAQSPVTDRMNGPSVVRDACLAASHAAEKEFPCFASPPSYGDVVPTVQDDTKSTGTETRTTVMLKGLPDKCTRSELLRLLDTEGFFGRFNFVYLPVDFKRNKNLGYALINLVSPAEALRLSRHFEGFSSWNDNSICTVAWCSPHQGLQAHVERYRNSPVMHESVPHEWRPLLLAHGVPVAFPAPTMKIKAPKMKGIQ